MIGDRTHSHDPRRLRELIDRFSDLAEDHALTSVVVGLAGPEGDPEFPDVIDYVESELRVEDSIFRMTRERAVLFVADVDRAGAEEIMDRILVGWQERASRVERPDVSLTYYEVTPGRRGLTVKDVLPALFVPRQQRH